MRIQAAFILYHWLNILNTETGGFLLLLLDQYIECQGATKTTTENSPKLSESLRNPWKETMIETTLARQLDFAINLSLAIVMMTSMDVAPTTDLNSLFERRFRRFGFEAISLDERKTPKWLDLLASKPDA